MNNPDRDIVLFLGAGFSWNAGLPTMANFGEEAKKQKIKEHAEARDRNAAPLLVSAKKTFEGFQKLLEQNRVLTHKKAGNMETVFCIAEALHESGIETIDINGSPKIIETLIEEIKLWLWKVYQQFPPENPERKLETEIAVFEKFFKIIKDANLQDRITVLSTNYDLVYEYCSYLNKIPCAYPLSWDTNFKAGFGEKQFVFQLNDVEGKTVVCKLHGSVNFFENTNEIDKKPFIASDLCDGQSIGNSRIRKNLPAIFAFDSIWNIRNEYGSEFVPAIIPPTYAKLKGYSWQHKIWNFAFNSIVKAKKIIFIGYSMPESDGFIRAFFHSALAMRKNKLKPEIHLIDPKPIVHKTYKKFFKSKFLQNDPMSFKDAVYGRVIHDLLQR